MELLGLLAPLLAAGGWLWFIRRLDRFEQEPLVLVLKTFVGGAAAGAIGLGAWAGLLLIDPDGFSTRVAVILTLVHLLLITLAIRLLPYRWPEWNDHFDGVVYGGATGVGYGLVYSLDFLLESPLLGFRAGLFTVPIYMLAGVIIGHFLSQVRFGAQQEAKSQWFKGWVIAGFYLGGFELIRAWGGAVIGVENPLASGVVYVANTVGWILALWTMDATTQGSRHHPENYRLNLSGVGCPTCATEQTVGAAYCYRCGRPVMHRQGVQG